MAAPLDGHNCKVVTATVIAAELLREVRGNLNTLTMEKEYEPLLVGFLANEDPAAEKYAEFTAKTTRENGFRFELRKVLKEEIEDAIEAANKDVGVNGIIVYYPIYPDPSRQDQYIQQLVSREKDVEGLTHKYIFNMYNNVRFLDPPVNKMKSILPCTPLAILKVLDYLQVFNNVLPLGNRLYGKTITIINRSEVVGRPLAALLANDGAKVFSVDEKTVQLFTRGEGIRKHKHEVHDVPDWSVQKCLPYSDVVISGVPGKSYKVDTGCLKEGVVCINFSSEKNFNKEDVIKKASIYVPAIGKVTIACLLRNLLRLVHDQQPTVVGRPPVNQVVPPLQSTTI